MRILGVKSYSEILTYYLLLYGLNERQDLYLVFCMVKVGIIRGIGLLVCRSRGVNGLVFVKEFGINQVCFIWGKNMDGVGGIVK